MRNGRERIPLEEENKVEDGKFIGVEDEVDFNSVTVFLKQI